MSGQPGTVQFGAATYTGTEGNSLSVSATRTGGSYSAVSMNYATLSGNATSSRYTPVAGTLSWADGESATKTINIPILNDGIAEPDQTFSLNLGIPMGGVFPGGPGATTITVTMPVSQWRSTYFTAAQLQDPNYSGDLAIPLNDGVPNLLKYAFGLNPLLPAQNHLPTTAIQNIGGINYLTLAFRRKTSASDLLYTPQSGPTLGTWTGTPVQVGTPTDNGDGTQTVEFRDSTPLNSATARFMRLQVLRSP
jgi:hypothetical protein